MLLEQVFEAKPELGFANNAFLKGVGMVIGISCIKAGMVTRWK